MGEHVIPAGSIYDQDFESSYFRFRLPSDHYWPTNFRILRRREKWHGFSKDAEQTQNVLTGSKLSSREFHVENSFLQLAK